MTEKENQPEDTGETPGEFPVAAVRSTASAGQLLQSRMWWLTLICLVLAIWMAWNSLPEKGTEITIRFPEGHGLKAGDSVRYRGIDVGIVTEVSLNEELSGVDVGVMLKPKGGQLNREGSRFWIVRPEISLTKVAGLETAVGAKYIGVSPGQPGAGTSNSFDGLPAAPADELSPGGIHLVLRSDSRGGLNAGAPVTWRGVAVGQVLSVSLSPDARNVLTSIHIDREYKNLVRTGSKFWTTSGFGVDVSLSGLKLNAESLATIARGGVSFITTADGKNKAIPDGHVFALASAPKEEWLESAANLPLIEFPLPSTVAVRYERTTRLLGIPRTREMLQVGLLIREGNQTKLLTAMIKPGGDGELSPTIQSGARVMDVGSVGIDQLEASESGLWKILLPADLSLNAISNAIVPASAIRQADGPEECLIVRSAGSEGDTVSLMHSLSADQLVEESGIWQVTSTEEDLTPWHGAPAVSLQDGKVIGTLVVSDSGPIVVRYATEWNQSQHSGDSRVAIRAGRTVGRLTPAQLSSNSVPRMARVSPRPQVVPQ